MHKTKLTWMALAGTLAWGCSADPKPPPATPPAPATAEPEIEEPAEARDEPDASDETSGVQVDERIAKMCNLPEARFDFDSSNLSAGARSVLDALASCFKDGAGKDQSMRIVGHADSRGETVYNFALGQKRAGAVAGYLSSVGLGEDRIATSSRGELEATGHDDSGWARDRRVEIFLAE